LAAPVLLAGQLAARALVASFPRVAAEDDSRITGRGSFLSTASTSLSVDLEDLPVISLPS